MYLLVMQITFFVNISDKENLVGDFRVDKEP
jgi:hypothetical protein